MPPSNPNLTATEAIQVLRGMADEVETMFYVYVVDDEEHLIGTFSLNNLIFATPRSIGFGFHDQTHHHRQPDR